MSLTPQRMGGPEYNQRTVFEDDGSGGPTAAGQLVYSNGILFFQDALGSFNVRDPWNDIVEGSCSDTAGATIYKTVTFNGALPLVISYFSDSAKTKRICSKTYVYGGAVAVVPSQIIHRIYAADGTTVRQTATDTPAYTNGVFETSRTRAIS